MAWGPFFFLRPRAVRMHLYDGRIHLDRLDLDAHNLLPLQSLKDLVQNTALRPAIHAGIDGMPRSEPFWQSPPLATMLRYIEQRIQKLQVGYLHVAPLTRQLRPDPLILRFRDLHLFTISEI